MATLLACGSFVESAGWQQGQPGLSVFVIFVGVAMKVMVALLIAISTLLGGCVVVPYGGGYYDGYRGSHGYWGHGRGYR